MRTEKPAFSMYAPIWALKIIAGKKGYSLQKAREIDLGFAILVAELMKEILDSIKQQQYLKKLFLYQQWQQSLKELRVVTEVTKNQQVEAAIEIIKQTTDGTVNEAELYDLKKAADEAWAPLDEAGYDEVDLQMLDDQIAEVQADLKSDPDDEFVKMTLRQLKRQRTKMINEMKKRAAYEAFKKEQNLDD